MAPTAPPLYVEPPAVVPAGFGLAAVAGMPPTGDAHWQNGIQYQPLDCDPAGAWGDPCAADQPDKSVPYGVGLVTATPFTVYAGWNCKAVGYTEAEILQRAQANLLLGEWRAVEDTVWTGALGNTPALATADADNLGTAADPVDALALLEDYLGQTFGGQGVIHMSRYLATHLITNGTITPQGDRLMTGLGTLVAAGGGYTANTGPDGTDAAAGSYWMYATGPVSIRRSEVFVNPDTVGAALNRTTNDVLVLAERTYVVDWACAHGAVLVGPEAGG
jgi:hypothetical protein